MLLKITSLSRGLHVATKVLGVSICQATTTGVTAMQKGESRMSCVILSLK